MSNVTAKETIERLSKYSELIGAKSQQMIEAGNKHEYSTVIKIQNEIKVFELEVSRLQSELLGGYGQLQQLPITKEDATAGTDIAAGGNAGGILSQKKQSPKKKKITVKLRPGSNNDTQKLKLPTYRERPKKQHDQIANNNDNETAKAMKVSEGKFLYRHIFGVGGRGGVAEHCTLCVLRLCGSRGGGGMACAYADILTMWFHLVIIKLTFLSPFSKQREDQFCHILLLIIIIIHMKVLHSLAIIMKILHKLIVDGNLLILNIMIDW